MKSLRNSIALPWYLIPRILIIKTRLLQNSRNFFALEKFSKPVANFNLQVLQVTATTFHVSSLSIHCCLEHIPAYTNEV